MTKRLSRRNLFIGLASLVVLLIAGIYTWQSLAAWRTYETRLTAEQSSFESLRSTALTGETSAERLTAVRTLDDKLAQRDTLCDINPLFAWQATIIPVLRDGVKRCHDKVRQLGVIAGPLHALRVYLDTGQKLQGILTSLAPGTSLTDSNWAEQGLAKAKKAQTDIKALPASGDATKLKESSLKRADSLVKAWESLIKANEAKDKSGFITSSAAVLAAYADFAAIADTADEFITAKAKELTASASKL